MRMRVTARRLSSLVRSLGTLPLFSNSDRPIGEGLKLRGRKNVTKLETSKNLLRPQPRSNLFKGLEPAEIGVRKVFGGLQLGREGSDGGNRIGVLLCSTQHLGQIMVEAGLALDVGLYFGRRNDLGGAGQGRPMRGWRTCSRPSRRRILSGVGWREPPCAPQVFEPAPDPARERIRESLV